MESHRGGLKKKQVRCEKDHYHKSRGFGIHPVFFFCSRLFFCSFYGLNINNWKEFASDS